MYCWQGELPCDCYDQWYCCLPKVGYCQRHLRENISLFKIDKALYMLRPKTFRNVSNDKFNCFLHKSFFAYDRCHRLGNLKKGLVSLAISSLAEKDHTLGSNKGGKAVRRSPDRGCTPCLRCSSADWNLHRSLIIHFSWSVVGKLSGVEEVKTCKKLPYTTQRQSCRIRKWYDFIHIRKLYLIFLCS